MTPTTRHHEVVQRGGVGIGYGFGLGFGRAHDAGHRRRVRARWVSTAGAAPPATAFWVDPKEEMITVLMTQGAPGPRARVHRRAVPADGSPGDRRVVRQAEPGSARGGSLSRPRRRVRLCRSSLGPGLAGPPIPSGVARGFRPWAACSPRSERARPRRLTLRRSQRDSRPARNPAPPAALLRRAPVISPKARRRCGACHGGGGRVLLGRRGLPLPRGAVGGACAASGKSGVSGAGLV